VQHHALRQNVASRLAKLEKRNYVTAQDLFCGSICRPEFTTLQFKPLASDTVVTVPAKGNWCNSLNDDDVATKVELQDGSSVDFSKKLCTISLGANNILEALQPVTLVNKEPTQARIGIDIKHTQFLANDSRVQPRRDLQPVIKKRLFLEQKLPQFAHILVIISNGHTYAGQPTSPQELPYDAHALLEEDPLTCLISNTDDGLYWALSPTLAPLLIPTPINS